MPNDAAADEEVEVEVDLLALARRLQQHNSTAAAAASTPATAQGAIGPPKSGPSSLDGTEGELFRVQDEAVLQQRLMAQVLHTHRGREIWISP